MNNEQLTAYLQDESYLYTLTYEELKTLVLQYPYAANLRILLMKKSFIEQNKDYDRNLQMAATYSVSRRHLFLLTQKLKQLQTQPQNVILGEDYLELTDLQSVEIMLNTKILTDTKDKTDTPKALAADWVLNFDEIKESELNQDDESEDLDALINAYHLEKNGKIDFRTIEHEADIDALVDDIVAEIAENKTTDTTDDSTILLEKNNGFDKNQAEIDALDFDFSDPSDSSEVENIEEVFNDFKNVEENAVLETEIHDLSDIFTSSNVEEIDLTEESLEIVDNQDSTTALQTSFEPKNTEGFDLRQLQKGAEVDEDMKKIVHIDLEITNEHKAAIKDDLTEKDLAPKLGFADWLGQFKKTKPLVEFEKPEIELKTEPITEQKSEPISEKVIDQQFTLTTEPESVEVIAVETLPELTHEPTLELSTQLIDIQQKTEDIITVEEVSQPDFLTLESHVPTSIQNETEEMRVLSQSRMAELFEAAEPMPDNLFGLAESASQSDEDIARLAKKMLEAASTNDDSDIDVPPTEGGQFSSLPNAQSDDFSKPKSLEASFSLRKPKKKKRKMHDLAKNSLVKSDDMISETLADMLAAQGSNEKAIEMYERLGLIFPEKSDYFAAKIEKLRIT